MRKLVIIPAYNEEKNIKKVVDDIQKNAEGFDYIIINDCSTDGTLDYCIQNGYRYLNLPINLGIGGAVQTGYKFAYRQGYDMAVQFDGDGQHDALYLNGLAEELLKSNADMIIGSRFIEKQGFQSSRMRRIGIGFFTKLIHMLSGKTITDPTSGMRIVNRKLMKRFMNDYPTDYPEPESVVAVLKDGYAVQEMPVLMREREWGESSINFGKSVYYMIKVSFAILIAWMK